MQNIISALEAYFTSEYLKFAIWLLLLGYLLAYGLAFLLARAGGTDQTILFRSRRAWAIAMLVHLLAVIGFTIKWFLLYGIFKSFLYYIPWYVAMMIFDCFVMVNAFVSIHRVSNYQD